VSGAAKNRRQVVLSNMWEQVQGFLSTPQDGKRRLKSYSFESRKLPAEMEVAVQRITAVGLGSVSVVCGTFYSSDRFVCF